MFYVSRLAEAFLLQTRLFGGWHVLHNLQKEKGVGLVVALSLGLILPKIDVPAQPDHVNNKCARPT